jgi:hypothetical protein
VSVAKGFLTFLSLVWSLVPAALAADLLYLYAQGDWTDPVAWIRTGELIALGGIIALSLVAAGKASAQLYRRQAALARRQGLTSGGKLCRPNR